MTMDREQTADLIEQDARARKTAQTEFAHPLVIEAGAGTGKTAILTARILVWCLGEGWNRMAADTSALMDQTPDAIARSVAGGVVALTFTEAAAAEMLARVTADLWQITHSATFPVTMDPEAVHASPDELQTRSRALLGAVGHLRISTIHSFCLSLLHQFPIEAGLPPDATVQPDVTEVQQIVLDVVRDRVVKRYSDDRTLVDLAVQGIGADAIADVVTHLVDTPISAQALRESLIDLNETTQSQAKIQTLAAAFIDRMEKPLQGQSKHLKGALDALELCQAIRPVAGSPFKGFSGLLAFAKQVTDIVECHTAGKNKINKWRKGDFTDTERGLDPLAQESGPQEFVEWSKEFAFLLANFDTDNIKGLALVEQALPVIKDCLLAVRGSMESKGTVTFNELLIRTRDLLSNHPRVAAMVRGSIHQILVDEFQDTSAKQCDIMRSLALTGPQAQRPKLFLVGDPKQSIYSWRSADLAAYDGFVDEVLAADGHKATLHRNFRSLQPILDEVQRAISPIMNAKPGIQPPFERLVAHRNDEAPAAPRRAVEYWTSDRPTAKTTPGPKGPGDTWNNDDAEAVEAEVIARDMADLHRSGVPWNEMALLLRATTAMDRYLDAFKRRGVPYTMTKSHGYYRHREVIEAAAVCQVIFDPTDHVALITVLRSPLAGVPDAALQNLWEAGIADLTRRLGSSDEQTDAHTLDQLAGLIQRAEQAVRRKAIPRLNLIDGWTLATRTTLAAIADLRRKARTATSDQFVDRMRRLLPTEPLAAARFAGPHRLANLERFFTRLTEQMEGHAGHPRAMAEALQRAIQNQVREPEAERADTVGQAVVVTTIHGAKGLGFDHVYLANLHHKSKSNNKTSAPSFLEYDGHWYFRLFGHTSWNYAKAQDRAKQVQEAEAVRLLYVAMTRAKNRLVLVGKIPWWKPNAPHGSLLRLLSPRLTDDPKAPLLGAAPPQTDTATRDDQNLSPDDDIRWRFAVEELERSETGPSGSTSLADEQPPVGASHSFDWNRLLTQAGGQTEDLAARRNQALKRMNRPLSAPATSRTASQVEALFRQTTRAPGGYGHEADKEQSILMDRSVAMAVGTAIHKALETWDLCRPPAQEGIRQLERIEHLAVSLPTLSDRQRETYIQGAAYILRHLGEPSPLMERLLSLADHIMGRELPVLGPANLAQPWSQEPAHFGPISHVTGAIDLLYEDPSDVSQKTLVVADYKTDRINDESDLPRHEAVYRPQIEFYARCVAQAYPNHRVRMELWFVTQDRIIDLQAV